MAVVWIFFFQIGILKTMSSFIVQPPPAFIINDDKVEDRFVEYKNKFLTFMKANGLDSKEEGQKIAILKSYCGEDLREQIEADETDDDSLNDILQRLHDHYLPAANLLQERFNFFIRRQRPSENFDKYLIELKKIVKNCSFGDLEENMLKVVLIMNMKDYTEQQKFLKDADSKKLETLIPDFRKFDAEKNKSRKHSVNNKNQEDKQKNNPQAQKLNNPQTQKQNAPQPPKQNYQPQKECNHQKQNPPKQKQNQDSNKKESHKNHNANSGPKDKKGNTDNNGNGAQKDKKPPGEKKRKPQGQQQPNPANGNPSTSLFSQLEDRIKNLSF